MAQGLILRVSSEAFQGLHPAHSTFADVISYSPAHSIPATWGPCSYLPSQGLALVVLLSVTLPLGVCKIHVVISLGYLLKCHIINTI
jgi:hypothetical protein